MYADISKTKKKKLRQNVENKTHNCVLIELVPPHRPFLESPDTVSRKYFFLEDMEVMVTPSHNLVFEVASAGQEHSFALLQNGVDVGEMIVEDQPFPKLLINGVLRGCQQVGY